MPRPYRQSFSTRITQTILFPWQGAVLVFAMTVGAAVHAHPAALRTLVARPQIASWHAPASPAASQARTFLR